MSTLVGSSHLWDADTHVMPRAFRGAFHKQRPGLIQKEAKAEESALGGKQMLRRTPGRIPRSAITPPVCKIHRVPSKHARFEAQGGLGCPVDNSDQLPATASAASSG